MKLPGGLRWWELLPEAAVALGLGVFLATETDAATSAFESRRAIGLMVGGALGWLALRFVLVRFGRWPVARLVVFAAAAIGVLAVVVLPAYDDETVIEALPVDTVMPSTSSPSPPSSAASASESTVPRPTTTAAPAPQPVLLASAELHGIDHRATGRAAIYRQPSGRLVVGLEEIDIQPGPDYDVYVVPGSDREDVDGGIRLDDLRGNQGTQYYEVPEGTDITGGDWTVLVWCQTFDVPVAGATPG